MQCGPLELPARAGRGMTDRLWRGPVMFKGTRVRFRARWWFAADAILLALAAKGELDAVTAAQLGEYAADGAS